MIKRHYVDTGFGQIHVRTLGLDGRLNKSGGVRPLVLLHPMPYSSLYFTTIMPLIASDRAIVAIDYPGCGRSDELDIGPSIEGYAEATMEALDGLGIEGQCDFLGFHTGCLVAAEIAITSAAKVGSSILVDIPFFNEEKLQSLMASQTSHKLITEDLSCLQKHWDVDVKTKLGIVSVQRAFEIFVDHMGAQGDGADGFRAAFAYPVEEKLAWIETPTLIIATKSGLYDGTIAAAKLIKNSELMELLEITRAAFEEGAEKIAAAINNWRA